MKSIFFVVAGCAIAASALAKLPAPSDEAKAKAAEAAAKAAHGGKVEAYLLCKSQDKTAAHYVKAAKAAGKEIKPAAALPACADPGAFDAAAASGAPAAPATTAAPDKAKKKAS